MAFIARVEFWNTSTGGDGIPAIVLDSPVAPAETISADMDEPADLPVSRESYAVYIFGVEGLCFITKGKNPSQEHAMGRLVPAGTGHWFIAKKGEKYFVGEYVPE